MKFLFVRFIISLLFTIPNVYATTDHVEEDNKEIKGLKYCMMFYSNVDITPTYKELIQTRK